jgi:spore maturation protein CgeB
LNFNYPDYWSDRIYETLGRGGFLIHPYIPGIEKEFVDKKHVVFYEYGNFQQLKELIDYYLINDEEREAIRKAGHELVKNNYTYSNRWQTILKELGL